MEKDKLHEDLKQLSGYIYKDNNIKKPEHWISFNKINDTKTGLYGEAFVNGNNIVIVYRGTDFKNSNRKDLISDTQLFFGITPLQKPAAKEFFNKINEKYKDKGYNIMLSGHSLGGSLAQSIGAETGTETVTFEAYGTGEEKDKYKEFNNIINYGNINDPIFRLNIDNQLGQTKLINETSDNGNAYKIKKIDFDYNQDKHLIENMGELSNATEYKGINFQEPQDYKFKQKSNINDNKQPLLKAKIEENVDYKDVDHKRVFTLEEIKNMPQDEFLKNKRQILEDFTSKKIISQSEADEQINKGDLIWVNSYTREDGTEVKGYYRSR